MARALAVRSNWGWLNHVGRWVVGRGLCIVGRVGERLGRGSWVVCCGSCVIVVRES